MTPDVTITNENNPVGNIPPLSEMTLNPVEAPSMSKRPARKTIPTTRNVTSAVTLMIDAQNSISPKSLTEMMFMVSTMQRAMSAISHCGIAPNIPQ
ncbi:Uncharacterised protein [Mycobacteroides abscessus subsp. abscessus]|nr:Uncharacterised protein [Mycobacteroides abscessus subsp. abscessus]